VSDQDSFRLDASFPSLVLTLSSSAWVSLGKIADPISGELKQDLRAAKFTIDTLIMLREKTRGNLDADEKKLIDALVNDLQANYAETIFIEKESPKADDEKAPEAAPRETEKPATESAKKAKKPGQSAAKAKNNGVKPDQ